MSPAVVRDVEVTISLVTEDQPAGTRWFASARFHGYADEARISGFFDYSYTPYASAAAAAQDAVVRTRRRLDQLFGLPVVPVIRMPMGSPPKVSATLTLESAALPIADLARAGTVGPAYSNPEENGKGG